MSKKYIDKFNYDGFKMILQSTQDDLLDYFGESLPKLYGKDNCLITDEYIFAKGNIPVVMVSHLDTVHTEIPKDLFYDKEQHVIWSPQGCGGDDRCGVLGNLFIAKEMGDKRPSLLFTTNEEIGCVGAKKATTDEKLKELVKDVKYTVEIDRKGKDDAVFYGCDNEEFQKYVCKFGFKKQIGSNSDVAVLCKEDVWNKACVNISSGYYNPHQKIEYIRVDELFTNIGNIITMLNDIDNVEKFTFHNKKKEVVNKTTKTETKDNTKAFVGDEELTGEMDIEHYLAKRYGYDLDNPFYESGQLPI